MSTDRRTHIAKEILSTERTFVKNLKTIVDVCTPLEEVTTRSSFINCIHHLQVFLLPLRLAIDDGRTIIKQRNIERIL